MKYLKIIAKIILGFILILLLIWGLVQFSAVQHYLNRKITEKISTTLQTHVQIGKIKLNPFKRAVFEDVVIRDQFSNTLLAADKLEMDIRFFSLLRKKIQINAIYLDQSRVKGYGLEGSDAMNYSFLFEQFNSNKSSGLTPSWKLEIGRIVLDEMNISLIRDDKLEMNWDIPNLIIKIDRLDIEEREIKLKDLQLIASRLSVQYRQEQKPEHLIDSTLHFPFIGWTFNADKIELSENEIFISNIGKPVNTHGIDLNHLDLSQTNLSLRDFQWKEDLLEAEVHDINFKNNDHLFLKSSKGKIIMTPTSLQLENLNLETAGSSIVNNSALSFREFNDLNSFRESVNAETEFGESIVSCEELLEFMTALGMDNYLNPKSDIVLQGHLQKKENQYTFSNVKLEIIQQLELGLHGGFSLNQENEINFDDLQFRNIKSSYQELKNLFPGIRFQENLREIGAFDFSCILDGNLNKLYLKQLRVNSEVLNCEHTDLVAFNLNDLNSTDVSLKTEKLTMKSRGINKFIPDSLRYIPDNLGFIEFAGNIYGGIHQIKWDGKFTAMTASLDMDGKIDFNKEDNSKNYLTNASFAVDVRKLIVSPKLNRIFVADSLQYIIDSLGFVEFEGTSDGNMQQVNLNGEFKSDIGILNLEAIVDIDQVEDSQYRIANTEFKTDISELKLNPSITQSFVPYPHRYIVDSLGVIGFSGNIKGDFHQINLEGSFSSNPGSADIEASIDFDKWKRPEHFAAAIDFSDFNFKLFTNDFIDLASGIVRIEGIGIDPDSLDLKWETEIESMLANDYEYKNIEMEGSWENNKFISKGNIKDEFADAVFEVEASLKNSIPVYKLSLLAEKLDLYRIKLSSHPLSIQGYFDVQSEGKTLDDAIGRVSLKNWKIYNDSIAVNGDQMNIHSEYIAENAKKITMQSGSLKLQLEGKFNLSSLPWAMIDLLNNYFILPYGDKFISQAKKTNQIGEQDFIFSVEGTDLSEYTQVLFPDLQRLDALEISGEINTQQKDLAVKGTLEHIAYRDLEIDSFTIDSYSDKNTIYSHLEMTHLVKDKIEIPQFVISSEFGNQILNFKTDLSGNNGRDRLAFAGSANQKNGAYEIHLDRDLMINEYQWTINPENLISFKGPHVEIKDLHMSYNDQRLAISTLHSEGSENQAPINVNVINYRLGDIVKWIDPNDFDPKGILNGNVQVFDMESKPYFNGKVNIDEFELRGYSFGNIELNLRSSVDQKSVGIEGKLDGKFNQLELTGEYQVLDGQIDANMDVRHFDLKSMELLALDKLENIEGEVVGQLGIKGSVNQFVAEGELTAHQVKAELVDAKSIFTIPICSISFTENEIKSIPFQVLDEKGRVSNLYGSITHQYFRDFYLNMHFESDEFQVLNTENRDHELFFGSLIIKASADIKGPPNQLALNINAITAPGTKLTLKNSSQLNAYQKDNFIVFMHPDEWENQGILERQVKLSNPYEFDLNANLEITPDADLTIIMDPESGDELQCQGNANLTARMDVAGNLDLAGNYTFTKGIYKFDYVGLVRKEFEIVEGSSLLLPGASDDYRFNVTATYKTKTSTLSLIENQTTLTDEERHEANKPTDIIVLLLIQGSLAEPQMRFQIQAPGVEEGQVGNAISRRLTQLNENPDEMNRQILGLLLFNSFLAQGQFASSESLTRSAEAAAFASLRGMITSQLNKLADQYLKGFEVNFEMDAYNSGLIQSSNGLVTEMGVSVSKKLLNDRLRVQLGSNVNLSRENVALWSDTAFSSIAGDFVIEYKLNEKGNYLVRVFHLNDYNIIEDESNYKTGVGFVIRKNLQKKRKKKKTTNQ